MSPTSTLYCGEANLVTQMTTTIDDKGLNALEGRWGVEERGDKKKISGDNR
jgi:hypothetical protein